MQHSSGSCYACTYLTASINSPNCARKDLKLDNQFPLTNEWTNEARILVGFLWCKSKTEQVTGQKWETKNSALGVKEAKQMLAWCLRNNKIIMESLFHRASPFSPVLSDSRHVNKWKAWQPITAAHTIEKWANVMLRRCVCVLLIGVIWWKGMDFALRDVQRFGSFDKVTILPRDRTQASDH